MAQDQDGSRCTGSNLIHTGMFLRPQLATALQRLMLNKAVQSQFTVAKTQTLENGLCEIVVKKLDQNMSTSSIMEKLKQCRDIVEEHLPDVSRKAMDPNKTIDLVSDDDSICILSPVRFGRRLSLKRLSISSASTCKLMSRSSVNESPCVQLSTNELSLLKQTELSSLDSCSAQDLLVKGCTTELHHVLKEPAPKKQKVLNLESEDRISSPVEQRIDNGVAKSVSDDFVPCVVTRTNSQISSYPQLDVKSKTHAEDSISFNSQPRIEREPYLSQTAVTTVTKETALLNNNLSSGNLETNLNQSSSHPVKEKKSFTELSVASLDTVDSYARPLSGTSSPLLSNAEGGSQKVTSNNSWNNAIGTAQSRIFQPNISQKEKVTSHEVNASVEDDGSTHESSGIRNQRKDTVLGTKASVQNINKYDSVVISDESTSSSESDNEIIIEKEVKSNNKQLSQPQSVDDSDDEIEVIGTSIAERGNTIKNLKPKKQKKNQKIVAGTSFVASTSNALAADFIPLNPTYRRIDPYNTRASSKSAKFQKIKDKKLKKAMSCKKMKDTAKMEGAKKKEKHEFGGNIINPNSGAPKTGLRPVIIDASNVAVGHGKGHFSVAGLKICIKYFLDRGHKVVALAPKFRRFQVSPEDRKILDDLETDGVLSFTPSRTLQSGKKLASYDDRFIVQTAAELGGVVVSTDNYRDLLDENEAWRETIEQRLLMFTWVGDMLLFPHDPLGRNGPHLQDFLRFPDETSAQLAQL